MRRFLIFLIIVFLPSICFGQWFQQKPWPGTQLNYWEIKGLVAYWPMSEGGGPKIYDISGNCNHGTFYGDTKWVPGKFGSCLSFDGDGDYVGVNDAPSLKITKDLTLSIWICPKSVSYVAYAVLVSKWAAGGAGYSYFFALNDDEIQLRISGTGSDYNNKKQTVATNLVIDRWYHIIAVYYAGEQDIKIYVNGINQSTTVTGTIPSSIFNSTTIVRIGGWTTNYDFNGSIDHVMIFNRALTAGEIQKLYEEPFCLFQPVQIPLVMPSGQVILIQ